ncbi:MAG: ABC transporter ATP-binding protein [Pseudomonadota bacterium]
MLELENLTADVPAGRVVHGLSLSVGAGESIAILGASGSGKSLSGRAVLALPPRGVRYGGRVRLAGTDLLTLGERKLCAVRGKSAAMIFQEPATALNPVKRIGTQIAEPLAMHTDLARMAQAERVDELLDVTGLKAAGVGAERYPHELSGGQRQRVAVAIALALSPKVIVADEPTSALDAVSAAKVLDLLFRLTAEAGTALILITHDMAVASRAGRIAVMDGGRLVEEGAARAVLSHPRSEAAQAIVKGTRVALPSRPAARGEPILSVRGVTVRRGGVSAVEDASLSVRAGERLAIVGGSGAGKTSLVRAILGLVPAAGRAELDGEEVPLGSRALRRAMTMVFQDPATSFNPRHSAGRAVAEALHETPLGRAEKSRCAADALARVGLAGLGARKPHAFSGGQRQRIAIARALVGNPRILIADEAVSALDAALRAAVVTLLDSLTRETGAALIFIAHDLGLVRTLADRIIVMDAGRIVEEGAAADIFSAPQADVTRALLAAADQGAFREPALQR